MEALRAVPLQSAVYDPDLADLEQRFGSATVPPPGRSRDDFDAFAARHRRIVTEFECYLEDKSIVDQQAVRLPEDATGGRSPILLCTILVRRITSNIENILQLLWEREAAHEREAHGPRKVFTGDRDLDNLESDEEGQAGARPTAPAFLNTVANMGARRANEAERRRLLEQAPKIVRLRSKVCRLLSDHEDVLAYDAEAYPAGTEKISKFLVLDVAQEQLDKVHTAYRSYAEVQLCSAINRRQMWDDSVNVPWETLIAFFAIFRVKWDPVAFLKRGHFRREEAFLVNEYLSRCFYLDPNNAQELALDLNRIDFHNIKYKEIYLRLPEHELIPDGPPALGEAKDTDGGPGKPAAPYNRQLFEKYIKHEDREVRSEATLPPFDPGDYDRSIFPFFDEAPATFERLFKFGRQKEFRDWIQKFKDPEEQAGVPPLDLKRDILSVGALGAAAPVYMVAASTLTVIRQDPQHMFNLTLSNFNNRKDDLLYLGRLQLASPLGYSKIEPTKGSAMPAFNVKIEYYIRGVVPTLLIKAFDVRSPEVLLLKTVNAKHIKMIIRICN